MTTSDSFLLAALDDQSDKDVLAALRKGQLQGLDVLFRRYGIKVYSLAYKILADAGEAEAITQTVFTSLLQPDVWQGSQDSVSAFLITLTRSRCLAQVEGRGWGYAIAKYLRGLFSSRGGQAALTTAQLMAEKWHLEQAEEALGSSHLLSTLSHKERDILGLVYYEATSLTTLAQRLHVPPNIVQYRSRKALIKLHHTRLTVA